MNFKLDTTKPFELATGLSYATTYACICKELRRQGFDFDERDWGHSLAGLLCGLKTNFSGFLVAAFIKYDIPILDLALLTDCYVMGDGSCLTCGGELEHHDTISEGHDELICNNCKEITEKYY